MPGGGAIVAALDREHEAPSRDGVAHCIVWPDASRGKKGSGHQEEYARFLPPKAEIGKPQLRGYNDYEQSRLAPHRKGEENEDKGGTTLQALRGWPGTKQPTNEQPPIEQPRDLASRANDINYFDYNVTGGRDDFYSIEEYEAMDAKRTPLTSKKTKDKSLGGSKNAPTKEDEQPPMGDLIAHRYLYEGSKKHSAGNKSNPSSAAGKKLPEARHTKASQLRQIHNGDYLNPEENPKEMWQIPKFKKVPPHISSFRKREMHPGQEAEEDEVQEPSANRRERNSSGGAARINTPFGRDSNYADYDDIYRGETLDGAPNHDDNNCMVTQRVEVENRNVGFIDTM